MVLVVAFAVVAAIALAWLLIQMGFVGEGTVARLEVGRKTIAVVWYMVLAAVLLMTGVPALQAVGFVVLFYMALVALSIYDLSLQSFVAMLTKPIDVIRSWT